MTRRSQPDPMHGAGDEYAHIDISLRVGGHPRVVVEGPCTNDEVRQVAQFLTDWARYDHKRAVQLWAERQQWAVEQALKAATVEVKREDYERARPLKCQFCRQRFKHQESLDRHVVRGHTIHWGGRSGRTLCGRYQHDVTTVPLGQMSPWKALCDECESAATEKPPSKIDTRPSARRPPA